MNTMTYAHFIAKREKANGSLLTYRRLFSRALKSAYDVLKYEGVTLVEKMAKWNKLDRRINAEKSVVRAAVRNAIKLGHTVSLNDGGEWTVKGSSSEKEVMAAVYTTDYDTLLFRKNGERVGTVAFVYGNSAGEVICDYTDNEAMAVILAPANRRADKYAELNI